MTAQRTRWVSASTISGGAGAAAETMMRRWERSALSSPGCSSSLASCVGTPPPQVIFYPDGTCTPFRVQFRMPDRASVLTIDPWTCAEVLPPKDPT